MSTVRSNFWENRPKRLLFHIITIFKLAGKKKIDFYDRQVLNANVWRRRIRAQLLKCFERTWDDVDETKQQVRKLKQINTSLLIIIMLYILCRIYKLILFTIKSCRIIKTILKPIPPFKLQFNTLLTDFLSFLWTYCYGSMLRMKSMSISFQLTCNILFFK